MNLAGALAPQETQLHPASSQARHLGATQQRRVHVLQGAGPKCANLNLHNLTAGGTTGQRSALIVRSLQVNTSETTQTLRHGLIEFPIDTADRIHRVSPRKK